MTRGARYPNHDLDNILAHASTRHIGSFLMILHLWPLTTAARMVGMEGPSGVIVKTLVMVVILALNTEVKNLLKLTLHREEQL